MSAATDDLDLALSLADIADEITLGRFLATDLVIETKPDLTPVTEADRAVERAVRERLGEVRAGDSVLGEEYGTSVLGEEYGTSVLGEEDGTSVLGEEDGTSVLGEEYGTSVLGEEYGTSVLGEEYGTSVLGEQHGASPAESHNDRRWIIDPIDGTKNYVRGIPVWATLLALQDGEEMTVGVVSAPAISRRWWAARGHGAFVSDGLDDSPRQISVSAVRELEDAQLCFPGLDDWEEQGGLSGLIALAARCWRSRGFGDFWSYMLVAEGAAEITCEPVVSLWDLAAPQVIVEEAGGRFTDLRGVRTADGGDAIATNGRLHEAALAILGR